MAQATISASSSVTDLGILRINAEQIGSRGGPVFPQLTVTVDITLRSAEPERHREPFYPTPEDPIEDYTLLQLYGSLFFGSSGRLIQVADFHSLPIMYYSRNNGNQPIPLAIPLDLFRIQQMEERRYGDVSLQFTFTGLFAKHLPVPRKQRYSPYERFETSFAQLTVQIPQSYWVNTVLPGLGYGKIHLVEVPIHVQGLAKTVAELKQAQEEMTQGNYTQVLVHCHNVLELLTTSRKYEGERKDLSKSPSFADKIDYLLSLLPDAATQMSREQLAKVFKSLYAITSSAHHASPPPFSRIDAQMTLLMTTAMLSYMGKSLSSTEEAQNGS